MSGSCSDIEALLLSSTPFAVNTGLATAAFAVGTVIARVTLQLTASAAVLASVLPLAIAISARPFVSMLR